MKYETFFSEELEAIDKTLHEVLPKGDVHTAVLHEAMSYAMFPGGKRFRAVLAVAASEACGKKWQDALIPAAAIELIHNYSLVHDDLPALDNDELRRGQLTVHKRYGEANAVLVGDSLLTLAFQVLGEFKPAEAACELVLEMSTAAGSYGMIGGQVADITAEGKELTLPVLDYINTHKTGKLIKASTVSGAIAAGASSEKRQMMLKYGELIGLAFQSVDDLLDGDGYLKLAKAKDIRDKTRDLIAQAKRTVKPLGKDAEKLVKLADYLLMRVPQGNHVKVDR